MIKHRIWGVYNSKTLNKTLSHSFKVLIQRRNKIHSPFFLEIDFDFNNPFQFHIWFILTFLKTPSFFPILKLYSLLESARNSFQPKITNNSALKLIAFCSSWIEYWIFAKHFSTSKMDSIFEKFEKKKFGVVKIEKEQSKRNSFV